MRRRLQESVGALTRWLLLVPAIILILLGCGQAGIASANIPVLADTRSRARADYSPWPFVVVRPLNSGVYEVIQADAGGELALASPALGEFWATATATIGKATSTPSVSPTASPSPTPVGSATWTASPVGVGTKVVSATPTRTATSVATATPSGTATRTRTPQPTATRTAGVPSGPAWWDCRYAYRKPIMIVGSRVVGDQTDFPVLVSLASDGDLASKARDNGFDLAFTSSDGTTRLAHEIEKFNGQTGELIAWVKVPMVSSSGDTVIYLYYGNPTSGDQQDGQAVWPGYEGVWHLNEAGGSGTTLSNSAMDDHHAMTEGTFYNPAGKIGGARGFADRDWHVVYFDNDGALFNGWSRWALEFWVYPDYPSDGAWASAGERFFLYADGPVRLGRLWRGGWEAAGQGTLQIDIEFANAGTMFISEAINRQAWNHIVYTYDGTDLRLLFNGVEVTSQSVPGDRLIGTSWFNLGVPSESLNGSLDELRISTRERSLGWVFTAYNNQSSPGSFARIGSETVGSACSP